MSANVWTVLARYVDRQPWTEWTTWVDRATAEAEADNARELGYQARVVDAASVDRSSRWLA